MEYKKLYHKDHKGDIRVWRIWTEGEWVKTEYGHEDGEMVQSAYKVEPKNVGKKNATTAEQQAEKEAFAEWKSKIKTKYQLRKEDCDADFIKPMLAKESKGLDKIVYPLYGQPKLDGLRCMAFWAGDEVKLLSRGGEFYTAPQHIIAQLELCLPKETILDGELYIHGKLCQEIASLARRRQPETDTLEYHIYDLPVWEGKKDLSFRARYLKLSAWYVGYGAIVAPALRLVTTKFLQDEEELIAFEEECVQSKYEGIMLRNPDGLYEFGYRSADLTKFKRFQDAEFEVVNVITGIGKFEGAAIFKCKNDLNDLVFEVSAPGNMDQRRQMWQDKDQYIGKKLTVKFQDRTKDGLPRFPVGKLFRIEEDLDD